MQCLDLYFTILTGSLPITENLACNVVFTRDQLITLRLSFVEKLGKAHDPSGDCGAAVRLSKGD